MTIAAPVAHERVLRDRADGASFAYATTSPQGRLQRVQQHPYLAASITGVMVDVGTVPVCAGGNPARSFTGT